jgi:hypothetical protein
VLRAIGDATWTSAALATGAEIERARGRLEVAGRHAAEAIESPGGPTRPLNVMIATGHLARAFAVRPLLAWWLD